MIRNLEHERNFNHIFMDYQVKTIKKTTRQKKRRKAHSLPSFLRSPALKEQE
jgi:hypothetical protein